jgi:amino acid permease
VHGNDFRPIIAVAHLSAQSKVSFVRLDRQASPYYSWIFEYPGMEVVFLWAVNGYICPLTTRLAL